jgi:hypothetical protein
MPSAGESRPADRISQTLQREAKGDEVMKLFYGWIIVGAGIVVTCVGFGAMFSLGVFLQPISAATGWSRTGISTAALLNFLCMGIGSFACVRSRTGSARAPLCSSAAYCSASAR